MKKIFTLVLVATGLALTASAQNRNDRDNRQAYPVYQQHDNRNRNDQYPSRDYGYNDRDNRGRRNDEYNRQAEYDRMNQQCDQRIAGYRNDRSLNRYERDRRIQEVEYERQQKAKAFGKGVVVGGIAAVLLGVLIAGGK